MDRPQAGEVHLYRFEARADCDVSMLTESERERAARYTLDAARHEFVAGRSMLRRVLGAYLDVSPKEIAIEFNANGKPIVCGAPLHFNVTHSAGRGVIAISDDCVGVDLQKWNSKSDFAGLVKRYFSTAEIAQFERMPEDLKPAAFFQGWTVKEAVLKAIGIGMAGVQDITVNLDSTVDEQVVMTNLKDEIAQWSIRTRRESEFTLSIARLHYGR
jgi:4'-phosphopantetheinyl transferase